MRVMLDTNVLISGMAFHGPELGNILLKQKPGDFPGLTDQLASLRSKYFSNLRLTRCRALSMDFTWRWSSSAISW